MYRLTATWTKLAVILLLAAALSKGFVNVFTNPPWQAADEVMHLEAAIISGRLFPGTLFPASNAVPAVQREIIQCMADHSFFQRLDLPRPDPLPRRFDATLFIRDAPSKVGREPLYYLLAGLPIRCLPGGVLQALYLSRILNLLILLTGLWLLARLLCRSSATPVSVVLFTGSLFLMNPAIWQLGAAMTTESWKFFLICLGLYIACPPDIRTWNRRSAVMLAGWILLVVASRWTLIPFALAIVAGAVILRGKTASGTSSRPWIVIGCILLPLLLVPFLIKPDILSNELNHMVSGFRNLAERKLDVPGFLIRITETFWTGFGWLNVPVPAMVHRITLLLSAVLGVLLAGYSLKGFRKEYRAHEPLWPVIVMGILIAGSLVTVRAASTESSIQGRYLYPAVPFMLLGLARVLSHLQRSRRWIMSICLCLAAIVDVTGTLSGWVFYQHIGYAELKDPVKALSKLTLTHADPAAVIIHPGSGHADAFLGSGWYPGETGASHRWMMHRANVYLPFLQPVNHAVRLQFLSFPVANGRPMDLHLQFNGLDIQESTVTPETYNGSTSVLIPANRIRPGLNILSLECHPALSPLDIGQSPDPRFLSLALQSLTLKPADQPGQPSSEMSGYYALPGSEILLNLRPGDAVGRNRLHFEDRIDFRLENGSIRQLWWDELGESTLTEPSRVTDMWYHPAPSERAVQIFHAFKESTDRLPRFLANVYVHLLLILTWLTFFVLAFLMVMGFIWHRSDA